MATSLIEENNLWIQTTCRPREGWALPGYFYPKHATWIAPSQPDQVTESVKEFSGVYLWHGHII